MLFFKKNIYNFLNIFCIKLLLSDCTMAVLTFFVTLKRFGGSINNVDVMITKYILPQIEYANIAPAPQCMQFRFFFPRHYLCSGKLCRQNLSVQIQTFYNKQRGTSASMYRENIKFVGTFYNEERKNIKKVKNTSMSKCCDRRRVHHKRTRFRQ